MIRKKKNATTWQVRVWCPAEGKNIYRSAPNERAARRLEAELKVEFSRNRTRRTTVRKWAEQWLALYPRPQETTRRFHEERISKFVEDFGDRVLTDITRIEARAWVIENPWRHNSVRALFNDAIDAGVARENPFARLNLPQSRGRRDLVVLTDDELGALEVSAGLALGGAYGRHFAACIRFAATTCVRPGELFALDWEVLDLDAGRAHIGWQERIDGRARPKNGLARDIVVPAPAVAALRDTPRWDGPWVFGSIRGQRLSKHSHFYAWDKVRNAAGRPGMDFYELRHYGATKLLEIGVSAEDVAIQMGHVDGGELVRTTYGHPSHARALDRVQNAWVADSVAGGEIPPLRAVS